MSRRRKILSSIFATALILLAVVVGYYWQRTVGHVDVPASSVSHGWTDAGTDSLSKVGGLVKIRTHTYKASQLGKVVVSAITPLPFVELTAQVDKQVARTLQENGATGQIASSGQIPISSLAVPYYEFVVKADDGSWNGKLLRATYHCSKTGDFIVVIAFGITQQGLLEKLTYDEARQMVQAAACS